MVTTDNDTNTANLPDNTNLYVALGEAQGCIDGVVETAIAHSDGEVCGDCLLRASDELRDTAVNLIVIANEIARTALKGETRRIYWIAGRHEVEADDER